MSVRGYSSPRALRRTAIPRYKRVMRRHITFALLLQFALVSGIAQARVPAPLPPAALYGELYQRVESEKLFADGLLFVVVFV